jgi:hypothetical protein
VTSFQKWFLWASSLATGASGVALWWMDRFMEPVSEWAVINHPLQPWMLKAHLLAAPMLVFALGLIAAGHIWRHFRARVRRARGSGVLTMWTLAPMVLSGYLIQVVTIPPALSALAWIHVGTGLAYLVGLACHSAALRGSAARRM